MIEAADSLLVKALPGIVVATVTQVALSTRGYLENQKRRRFLRAELAAETKECMGVLGLFIESIEDDIPESRTGLGVGLAIYIAPIRCRDEYERLTASIRNAVPALSDHEFQLAIELKRHLRLLVGYADACDRYFKQLQEAGLSKEVTANSVESRREVFRRFGIVAKLKIAKSASRIMEITFSLLESLGSHGPGDQSHCL